jgi:toxin ParE1/3/4
LQVIFTPLAERQLDSLYANVSDNAGELVAERFVARIVAYCQGLTTFPRRGDARDDLMPGLRTIGFERRATIAFIVTADAVLIEGVFYGGQDFETAF